MSVFTYIKKILFKRQTFQQILQKKVIFHISIKKRNKKDSYYQFHKIDQQTLLK